MLYHSDRSPILQERCMERYEIARFSDWAREPVIAKMKNGTLVCVHIGGGPTEPHNDNVVLYTKSYDDGESWMLK